MNNCKISFPKYKYIEFKNFAYKERSPFDVKFRFIDSFRFLGSPLVTLVSYLDSRKFIILRKEFLGIPLNKFNLLTRKGMFSYDYIDSWDNLKYAKLLGIDTFYNK